MLNFFVLVLHQSLFGVQLFLVQCLALLGTSSFAFANLLFANYWVRCLTISVLIKLLPISFVRFEGAPVCFRGCAGALFFRPQQDSNQRLYLVLPPR